MNAFRKKPTLILSALCVLAGGCAIPVSRRAPPPPRAFGEVESQERGVILSVTDTAIDPRTGRGPDAVVQAPVPLGPIVMGMPVTIGGEKRQDVPAEDLTIKLATGRLVQITQPRSAPPFAVGEPVLIQKERPNDLTGESRTRVVRDEDYSPAQVVR